jgi:hypothetical protein
MAHLFLFFHGLLEAVDQLLVMSKHQELEVAVKQVLRQAAIKSHMVKACTCALPYSALPSHSPGYIS